MAWLRIRHMVLGALLCGSATAAIAAPDDDTAIRGVIAAEESALNGHDAHAYASLLENDADVVIPFGWWLKGRAATEQAMAEAFRYVLAQARVHADAVAIRAIAPDLALVHVNWTATGVRAPDGSPGDEGGPSIESLVLRRSGGQWLIVSSQETNSLPQQAVAVKPKPARKCLVANRDGKCLVYR